jgi:hypothetical protein
LSAFGGLKFGDQLPITHEGGMRSRRVPKLERKKMLRYKVLALAAAFVVLADCDCIGTFAETSNPGREDGGVLKHYADTTGVKQRVMKRAAMAGATHLVWMHTYSVAAAAQAYRCPGAHPLAVVKSAPDAISEGDLN